MAGVIGGRESAFSATVITNGYHGTRMSDLPTANDATARTDGRRRVALVLLGVVACGLGVFAATGYAREHWYLWQLREGDEPARIAAARVLGEMGSTRAVPDLIAALKAVPRPIIDRQIVCATLGIESAEAAHYSVAALAAIGEPAVDSLMALVGETRSHSSALAAETLLRMGEVAVPALTEALGHENRGVRSAARLALAQMGERARPGVPALLNALEHGNTEARRGAAYVLGVLGFEQPKIVEALVATLTDADDEARWESTVALSTYGALAKEAVPGLTLALGDASWQVRRGAAAALGAVGPAATAALGELRVLAEGDAEVLVREEAGSALERISSRR